MLGYRYQIVATKLGRFAKSETYRKDKLAGSMVLESIN
jgi:hypothetical protein